jgi:hypothetical protein
MFQAVSDPVLTQQAFDRVLTYVNQEIESQDRDDRSKKSLMTLGK